MRRKSLKKFLVLLLTTSMVGTMYVPAMATEVRPSDTTVESTDEQNVTDDQGTAENDQENQVSVQSDEATGTEENTGAGVAQIGEKTYATLQEAVDASEAGATIQLLADVTEDVTITEGKNLTLDLNGRTLKNTGAGKATVLVNANAQVTVKNGTVLGGASYYNIKIEKAGTAVLEDIVATAGNNGSSLIDNWGTLTIQSGTYTGGLDVVKNESNGDVTINDGSFELTSAVSSNYNAVVYNYGNVKIYDGDFTQSATTPNWAYPMVVLTAIDSKEPSDPMVEIYGGNFINKHSNGKICHNFGKTKWSNFSVAGGTFNKDVANFLADGYMSVYSAKKYTVKKIIAQIGTKNYADLATAITKGGNVKLLSDITTDATKTAAADRLYVKKNCILDLNGHSITFPYELEPTDNFAGFFVNGATMTVKDTSEEQTGKIQTGDQDNMGVYLFNVIGGGTLILESGNYFGGGTVAQAQKGNVYVKGGNYAVKAFQAPYGSQFLLNCYDANRQAGTATIVVTGGSFEKFNPTDCQAEGEGTSFVAAGYEAKATGDVYTVSKKAESNLETVSSVAGSASIGGNYSGAETDTVKTDDNGKVSIDLKNENVTKISASTIYAGNDALASLNENEKVSDVMISTDAGTFTINKEALSTIVTNAKNNDVVLKLSKESKATGEVYYYVTATAGGQNVYTESTSATGTVKISVPYYTLEDGVTATVYYVDDSGNKTAMNTTYDSATKSLTWETSHFSTFEVQTNAVAQVTDASGNVEQYSDIKAAFDNAETGSTVALLTDVDITKSEIELADKDITLDLAGHEMKAANRVEGNIDVSGGKLILCDSTDAKKDGSGTGRIYTTTAYDYTNGTTRNDTSKVLIAVYSGSSFELESGLIDAASGISNNGAYGQFAIGFPGYSYDEDATITINGGRIKAGWYAIAGNGGNSASKADANIIVNGGIVESTADYAIYQPNKGKTTVNGGVVYGEAGGIALKAGDLVVTGGMITSKGQGSTGTWGDGTGNLKNAAINIDGAYAQASAIITGGTIMAEGDAINVATNPKKPVSAKVSGGIFNNPVKEEYCADGFYPQAKADGTYGVQAGAAVVIATDGTAEVYDTLAEAIIKADNATVKLLENTTQSIQIAANQTVTLDLNGYTLTNEAGKHTITNNGILTVKDSSTEKTGTVDNVSHAKAAIKNENGGLVTLNAGTYTRSMENGLSSSNNGGNSYYTLYNLGTMTIEGDVTVNQGPDGKGKYSSLVCNGGIKGQSATLTVNGGTFEGGLNSIKNDEAGELTITDGTFNNTAQYAILNWEKTSITGGTFTVSDSASGVLCNGSYEGSAGNISISGGTFTAADNKPVIEEFAGYADGTTGTITGGIFSSEVPAKYCQSSDESSEGYLPVQTTDANNNVIYTVDNSVQANFWGGQLRMDYYKNEDGTTNYTKTDLRFGYEYQVNPDIDQGAVNIIAWGWKYSVGDESLDYTLDGKNSRANTGLGKNYKTVTNLLITEVPTSAYQTDIYSQMYVTYEKDGKIYTAKTSIDHRSVSEIVNKILDDGAADDIQKKYAQGLKNTLE